jgi:predicted phosphodiesterase
MSPAVRRVAALYDIHGNLPALEAVVEEVRAADVDLVVVGGDVVPGPMPREALDLLLRLDVPAQFIHGNGELGVLAQIDAPDPGHVAYWGTASGQPLPPSARAAVHWNAEQVRSDHAGVLRSWPKACRVEVAGVGEVLFCHGTPRSETECFTRLTPAERLAPVFTDLGASLVVCGHTHMQFDRVVAGVRVLNAGSVGMPFGHTGADWLLLGPEVELRHSPYALEEAAARIRATAYPGAVEFAEQYVLRSPPEAAMLAAFTDASFPVRSPT